MPSEDISPKSRVMNTRTVEEGVDAYCAGIPRNACPYQPETQDRIDWVRGWDEAEELDLEVLGESMTHD